MQSSSPQQYLHQHQHHQSANDPTASPKTTTSITVAILHGDSPINAPYTGLTDANAPLAADSYLGNRDFESIRVNRILYSSAYLALFQAAQFGWSLSQLNLSTFHDADACNARPVVDGTCVMFPGHTSSQWTWAVNAWVLGGMAGSLGCGRLSDHYGRKPTFLGNCIVMALGALVQASASSVAVFALGRAIAGVASGVATAMTNGYISEIAPPHLRNTLGVGYQIAIALGILIVCATFFVADTSTGWRYIAGFPAVMALLFAGVAPRLMVESPTWLLARGRAQDAEREIAKLFGETNVALALAWMQQPLLPAAPQPRSLPDDGVDVPPTKSQELLTTSSSSSSRTPEHSKNLL